MNASEAAEVVYINLIIGFRKEVVEHGPGGQLAQDIDTAICVVERFWPGAVAAVNKRVLSECNKAD
jgi:hypothetical protein